MTTWDSATVTWASLFETWEDRPAALPAEIPPIWPVVGVWERDDTGANVWSLVGRIGAWTSIEADPRYNTPGTWTLVVPWSAQAAEVTRTRLVTLDWRGKRLTCLVDALTVAQGDAGPVLTVSGLDAMALLGHLVCFPTPGAPLSAQGVRYSRLGPAETLIRDLIAANFPRHTLPLTVPASQGRGRTVRLWERYSNLLEVVTKKAKNGGVGVRVGLVNTTGPNRAELKVEFVTPQDRTSQIRLSHRIGALRSWSSQSQGPTATRAYVGGDGKGAGRIIRQVVDTAAETDWDRIREVFVDAKGTSDWDELDERGVEALAEGGPRYGFELETVEAQGMRLFSHYDLGDVVSVVLPVGEPSSQRVGGAKVTFDGNGYSVQVVPGNPDATSPMFAQSALLRGLRWLTSRLEREEP